MSDTDHDRIEDLLSRQSQRPQDVELEDRVWEKIEAHRADGGQVRAPRRRWLIALAAAAVPLAAATALGIAVAGGYRLTAQQQGPAGAGSPSPGFTPSIVKPTIGTVTQSSGQLTQLTMKTATDGWALLRSYGRGPNTDADKLIRTTDGGAHWTDVSPAQGGTFAVMQAFDANHAVVIIGGASFSDLPGGLVPCSVDAPCPSPPPTTVSSRKVVVWRTDNGGAGWSRGEDFNVLGRIQEWSFADQQHGYIQTVTSNDNPNPPVHEYATDDGGVRWHERPDSSARPPVPPGCRPDRLPPVGRDGWSAVACQPKGIYLFRTLDGGKTWTSRQMTSPPGYLGDSSKGGRCVLQSPTVVSAGFMFTTAACGFSTGGGPLQYTAIYLSKDGGASWGVAKTPMMGPVHFFDNHYGLLHGVNDRFEPAVYETTSGGATWQLVSGQPPFTSNLPAEFYFLGDSVWMVGYSDKQTGILLYRSTDRGKTWEDLKPALP